MTFGSFFSGFGGLDLGFERAGFECLWQIENNETAIRILEKNFPNVRRYKDAKTTDKAQLAKVDIIAGGFPCQDISSSNSKGEGVEGGERSGLWSEMFDAVRVLRPRYALIENVTNLTRRGLDRVLSDLASIGYDAEWQTLSAKDFGFPHERKRLFIAAYPVRVGLPEKTLFDESDYRHLQSQRKFIQANRATVRLENVGRSYPAIPEHIRVDDGSAKGLGEIIRGIGNAVVPEIGEWIGKQIIRFDKENA